VTNIEDINAINIADALWAIRSDEVVGRFSCSFVDEAMSDDDVIKAFCIGANGKPLTMKGAVRKARAAHREDVEIDRLRGLDCW